MQLLFARSIVLGRNRCAPDCEAVGAARAVGRVLPVHPPRPRRAPGHLEANPSASFGQNAAGAWVYRDWHARTVLNDGRRLHVLTLPEVRAAQVSGVVRQLRGPELATWALRLLVEAGVMQPTKVDMPPLPSWVATSIHRTYEGFRLLLACRWLYTHGAPAPFTWDFAQAWTGLSRKEVGAAILHLRHEGILRFVGQHQRANLYLPGEGR